MTGSFVAKVFGPMKTTEVSQRRRCCCCYYHHEDSRQSHSSSNDSKNVQQLVLPSSLWMQATNLLHDGPPVLLEAAQEEEDLLTVRILLSWSRGNVSDKSVWQQSVSMTFDRDVKINGETVTDRSRLSYTGFGFKLTMVRIKREGNRIKTEATKHDRKTRIDVMSLSEKRSIAKQKDLWHQKNERSILQNIRRPWAIRVWRNIIVRCCTTEWPWIIFVRFRWCGVCRPTITRFYLGLFRSFVSWNSILLVRAIVWRFL